ncbi:hypothetical protein Pan97_23640 [Bremerella volcania]|uniref:PEGA domain protein n=1 Tax=Bremerella volcania TaxID=2527984 RepID=A0A518C7Z7_9BACT|nr:hypothetical protein [Bremerella volcania]QDU75334.1 hypothetical protein Pan97_23640 [Bremerella volcania]
MKTHAFSSLLVLLCLLFSGCGGNGIPRAAVQGTVTLDGKPIESGVIMFIPETVAPVALKITGGHYDSESDVNDRRGAVIGHCSVQIFANRPTGRSYTDVMTGEKMEETKQFVPAKYNERTELTAEVEAGRQTIDFHLES